MDQPNTQTDIDYLCGFSYQSEIVLFSYQFTTLTHDVAAADTI